MKISQPYSLIPTDYLSRIIMCYCILKAPCRQTIVDRQESLMTMMVRVHEVVKQKRTNEEVYDLPFLSSQEDIDTLENKLQEKEEKKKLVSCLFKI